MVERNWLAAAARDSPLAGLVQPFTHQAILDLAKIDDPSITYAETEVLIAASANFSTGSTRVVPQELRKELYAEASALLGQRKSGPFRGQHHLAIVRDIRPPWFVAPLYAELLSSFEDFAKALWTTGTREIFESALDALEGNVDAMQKIPPALMEKLTSPMSNLKNLGSFGDVGIIVAEEPLVLRHRFLDALYREMVRQMSAASATFQTRKGRALEDFVFRRLNRFFATWRIHDGSTVGGFEQDFLMWDDDFGLAVECKSVRVRGNSTDWSELNLDRDVEPIREAVLQVHRGLAVLRSGAIGSKGRIPARRENFGLVVTDEVFSSYLRLELDELDPAETSQEWHGKEVWVGSFLDFDFLLRVSGCSGVFLHYHLEYRNRTWTRLVDEPDAWATYRRPEGLVAVRQGVLVVMPEIDWDVLRPNRFDDFVPLWLRREELATSFSRAGRCRHAMRIVAQDAQAAIVAEKGLRSKPGIVEYHPPGP